jgi:hypothetical protein
MSGKVLLILVGLDVDSKYQSNHFRSNVRHFKYLMVVSYIITVRFIVGLVGNSGH